MMYKKQFIYFLKQNHVYEKFMVRFKNNNHAKKSNFKYFVERTAPESLLASAFPWDSLYWADISKKWKKELITKYDKIIHDV